MIILASASSVRRRLLANVGLRFSVHPADIDESARENEDVFAMGERLAREKALKVSRAQKHAWVIGVDQVGECRGEVLRKCYSENDARAQLKRMQGHFHDFESFASIAKGGKTQASLSERARVHFRALSDDDIGRYLKTREWRGSAGSYHLEGQGAQLVRKLEGHESAVYGLPLFALLNALREHGALT